MSRNRESLIFGGGVSGGIYSPFLLMGLGLNILGATDERKGLEAGLRFKMDE